MFSLGLINGTVYLNGEFVQKDVYIEGDKIAKITPRGSKKECEKIIDCSDKLILPGFIDPHVHLNLDLGEFKSSDNYETGSKAAAFGGITTFIDFLEPIKYVQELDTMLERKKKEAELSHIDYSFHTTIGNFKDDTHNLVKKSLDKGLPSIKLFTTYSESDRRCSYKKIQELLLNTRDSHVLVLAHTENDQMVVEATEALPDRIEKYAETRPADAELSEIDKLAQMAIKAQSHLYFVHVTCGSSVELLKEKYTGYIGQNIFIESCPQYFSLTKSRYQQENARLYLLAPPLRSKDEQLKLWKNIESINTIGTDHCPFTKAEKFRYEQPSKVPKGIGGMEFSFSLMYHLFGASIIDKFTLNPAKIHGLYPKKGIIQVGSDADVVVFDPMKEFVIDKGHSNTDYSPYEGKKVKGKVQTTILRGKMLVSNKRFVGEQKGEFIDRLRTHSR